MTQSLFDRTGNRKYLVARERQSFVAAAVAEGGAVGAFCLTLAFTGARISEALALTSERLDASNEAIVFETLKQRRKAVFRAVPVPCQLLNLIGSTTGIPDACVIDRRLWPWGRTTAWKHTKRVMKKAGITDALCKPKALRHGFAIDAGQNGVTLNIVQRWLGHARIETTAIYAGALGEEERALARRAYKSIEAPLAAMVVCATPAPSEPQPVFAEIAAIVYALRSFYRYVPPPLAALLTALYLAVTYGIAIHIYSRDDTWAVGIAVATGAVGYFLGRILALEGHADRDTVIA